MTTPLQSELHTAPMHPTTPAHHRFHLLDGMRGLAALLVFFFHVPWPFTPALTRYSYLAVDFFFCLSGFVIAFSYEKRLREGFGFGRFLVARYVRLYPIYLLGIVIGALVLPWPHMHDMPFHLVRNDVLPFFSLEIFMLPAIPRHAYMAFPLDFPAWSIFYEMLANILFAVLVVRRLASTRVLIAIVLLSIATMTAWVMHHRDVDVGLAIGATTIIAVARVLLSFFNGVIVYRLYRDVRTKPWTTHLSAMVGMLCCAVLIAAMTTAVPVARTHFWDLGILMLLFPAVVYVAAHCRVPAAWAIPCALLGELSYPLYLLHVPVLQWLRSATAIAYQQTHHTRGILLVPTLAAAIAVSFLASRFYDMPVRAALLRRINARNPRLRTQP
jgi:peptidoglycan/LPS O-acetylase OafA/YrhL